jgi:hypothetical protein
MRRALLTLVLLIGLAGPAWAAVTLDTTTCPAGVCPGANYDTDTTSQSTLTVSAVETTASTSVLFACVSSVNPTATSVTRGAQSFTRITNLVSSAAGSTASLWRLVNPTVGTTDVSVTWASNSRLWALVAGFQGVDTTTPVYTPIRQGGFFTGITTDAVTRANGVVLDCLHVNFTSAAPTKGASQTLLKQIYGATSGSSGSMSTRPGADYTIEMLWTWASADRPTAHIVAHLNPTGATAQPRTTGPQACDSTTLTTTIKSFGNGDTIQCTSATHTMDATVTIPDRYGSILGTGPLTGATPTSCSGSTLNNTMNSTTQGFLAWKTAAGGQSVLAGFCLTDNSVGVGSSLNAVGFSGIGSQVRVHHNYWSLGNKGGVTFTEYARGVVDHNYFLHPNVAVLVWYVSHASWEDVSNGGFGDQSWAAASTMGSADAVYFESNTVLNTYTGVWLYFTDGLYGERKVSRFNDITGMLATGNHGLESGGRQRSSRHTEAYYNKITNTLLAMSDYASSRGGTGRFFGNAATSSGAGSYDRATQLTTYRPNGVGDSTKYPLGPCGVLSISTASWTGGTATVTLGSTDWQHAAVGTAKLTVAGVTPSGYNITGALITGKTGTTVSYAVVSDPGAYSSGGTVRQPIDENSDSTGYRCADQIGAGVGDLVDSSATSWAWANQALEPFYLWNNTVNGAIGDTGVTGTAVIVENRDYYTDDGTAFTCIAGGGRDGVGIGTAAQMATFVGCTAGVGFWVTDEGTWNTSGGANVLSYTGHGRLYRYVSGAWVRCYNLCPGGVPDTGEPYTYPHPLAVDVATTVTGRMRLRY